MNITKTEQGRWMIYCHVCKGDHELGDIVIHNKRIYGLVCDTLLGYEWDLPAEVRRLL